MVNDRSTAIILAAGTGSRLYPLTATKPKALVSFAGKRLIDRQLEIFSKAGISDITVATGHCADAVAQLGLKTVTNRMFQSTNMVFSLFETLKHLNPQGDLIISYGDILFEKRILNNLLASNSDISVAIDLKWENLWRKRFTDPLDDAETLLLSNNGHISEIGNKPSSISDIHGQFIGLIKVKLKVLNALHSFYESIDRTRSFGGKSFENMFMTSFLQELIDNGWLVKAIPVHGGWLEIDTISDIERYHELLKNNELKDFYRLDS
jgi:choline kinase